VGDEKTYRLSLHTQITMADLVKLVTDTIFDHDELVEFVMVLDEETADLDFTTQLHARLSDVIKQEMAIDD